MKKSLILEMKDILREQRDKEFSKRIENEANRYETKKVLREQVDDEDVIAEWMDNKIAELQAAYYEEAALLDLNPSDKHFVSIVRASLEHNFGM